MKDMIFRTNKDGSLEFIGDFEYIYKNVLDPWDQSSPEGSMMAAFYSLSRKETVDFLSDKCPPRSLICEVGCGTGYLTNQLYSAFGEGSVLGCDISKTAIDIAAKKFSHIQFFEHNILMNPLPLTVDVVCLSNILWYVMHDMENLVKNITQSLNKSGSIVIHNALFKDNQKYMNDKVSSFGTMIQFMLDHFKDFINDDCMVESKYIRDKNIHHDWGIMRIKLVNL